MFLSKKTKEKPVCVQGLDSPSSVHNDGSPSVDLTMAAPGSSPQKPQYPFLEHHPLSSPATRIVTSSGSGVEEAEVAQVATESCSQTGFVRDFDMNRLPSETDNEDHDFGGGGTAASSAVSIVSPLFLSVVGIGTANDCKTDTASAHGGSEPSKAIYEEELCNNDDNNKNNNNSNNHQSALQNTGDHQEDEGDGDDHGGPRKKLRLSKEQSALLEESFREHHTLNPKQKNALAKQLNLRSRQVEVWFQNRRARTKLKQTEVDCEFLKRCCETLTQENRRLQREVEQLRAIKVAPPCVIAQDFYMPLPAATLTICPSCERVGSTIDKRALTFAKPSYYLTNFTPPSTACS